MTLNPTWIKFKKKFKQKILIDETLKFPPTIPEINKLLIKRSDSNYLRPHNTYGLSHNYSTLPL